MTNLQESRTVLQSALDEGKAWWGLSFCASWLEYGCIMDVHGDCIRRLLFYALDYA